MLSFNFTTVTRIVFGQGQVRQIGPIAASFGSRALVIHNTGTGADSAATAVAAALEGSAVRATLSEQAGEPAIADVDRALGLAREEGCEVVIGVGGGSAIDAAKAVAGLLTNGGTALDYMEVIGGGRKIARAGAPFIAVPTTAGTGAEVTRNAVIGAPEKKFKASIRSEHLLARVALIDPQLAATVPPEVTAASGMDALCQLIESYTSSGAQPLTDALALDGVARAARALIPAFRDGRDLWAREEMAMAAMLSGITLANAGLGAVHGFAAPIGANFRIPHGAVCALLLPHVIAANVSALRAAEAKHRVLGRYATVGRILAASPELGEEEAIDFCAEYTADLLPMLKIAPLARYGFSAADIPAMVGLARSASSMRYNPVALSEAQLAQILMDALDGGWGS